MSSLPTLSRITVYPIKSLDGVYLTEASVSAGGALLYDRMFAIRDADGNFVNGKRHAKIHLLRAAINPHAPGVTLWTQGAREAQFHLHEERAACEAWLGKFFGFTVTLDYNGETGFPDDTEASGATVISEATLEQVSVWFEDTTADEMRRRFRANIELAGCEAFWEDGLFRSPESPVEFYIGEVKFLGINPCARCVVPSRHPETGEPTAGFQKRFTEKRRETMPADSTLLDFGHTYRLSVNTVIPASEAGKGLRIGDAVKLISG